MIGCASLRWDFTEEPSRRNAVIWNAIAAQAKAKNRRIDADLWPLVMSGVPSHRICVAYVGQTYVGILLDNELVIEARP